MYFLGSQMAFFVYGSRVNALLNDLPAKKMIYLYPKGYNTAAFLNYVHTEAFLPWLAAYQIWILFSSGKYMVSPCFTWNAS